MEFVFALAWITLITLDYIVSSSRKKSKRSTHSFWPVHCTGILCDAAVWRTACELVSGLALGKQKNGRIESWQKHVLESISGGNS